MGAIEPGGQGSLAAFSHAFKRITGKSVGRCSPRDCRPSLSGDRRGTLLSVEQTKNGLRLALSTLSRTALLDFKIMRCLLADYLLALFYLYRPETLPVRESPRAARNDRLYSYLV